MKTFSTDFTLHMKGLRILRTNIPFMTEQFINDININKVLNSYYLSRRVVHNWLDISVPGLQIIT